VIRADLRSVTKQTTEAGNIRFTAERTPDGHADRFWALALAVHAGSAADAAQWRPMTPSKPQQEETAARLLNAIAFVMRGMVKRRSATSTIFSMDRAAAPAGAGTG
jgi:phage FluMu gp28-like protein